MFAAFLMAFFPTDIIFATIGFPDLINVFFINLGIYFLIKSYKTNRNLLVVSTENLNTLKQKTM